MHGHIFNIQDDGKLVEMNEQAFKSEDLFQTLIEKYPNLLAGDQINSDNPRRWLLIRREMGIPGDDSGIERWALDHLFLDQDAVPTFVEVKRSTDTRVRREVVGQILDYAANAVVYWSIEQVIAEFERQCEADGIEPHQRLQAFLANNVSSDDFWRTVKTNLQAGRIRLLIVADSIPPELRRIVEFLNAQMDPAEILAVEIKHFVGPGLKTLVPRVIGQTAEAEGRKGKIRKPPRTEEELMQIADEKGVKEIYAPLVRQMKPLFDSMTTTRSNVAFNGKIEGYKTGATIATLIPMESSSQDGLAYAIYIDRLAEFFDLEKEQVRDILPRPEHIEETGDWAGDIYRGFVKNAYELESFIALLKQAKSRR